jgi:spore coat polysaccharide biosynthesis protein SpsF
LCKESGVEVVTGPEEDVLNRYAIAVRHFGLTDVVRITGDCPLIDPQIVDRHIESHLSGPWDLTANLTGVDGGFPRGMDVEVVTSPVLHRLNDEIQDPRFREHVTLYLYENSSDFKVNIIHPLPKQARPDLRMCVDERSDVGLVEGVYEHFGSRTDFGLDDIITFLDEHSQIASLNQHVRQKSI